MIDDRQIITSTLGILFLCCHFKVKYLKEFPRHKFPFWYNYYRFTKQQMSPYMNNLKNHFKLVSKDLESLRPSHNIPTTVIR